ncbi:oligosaccharide flippase family protein [Novosphingobium sp. 9U]|uniref:oligosaccharide flippase family protein n=1 Tax=Novosphingobium sp. 9U TaxID=2653158 RepID=UPI0012F39BF8|nr:oligosaccharide flippase family protein [Novosphingobium sp. 9U]VWX53099.1 conserved membrane hypothetical protein [Novosphingobium sp. 9U]
MTTPAPANGSIAAKSLWTIGTYVGSAGIRFGSNVVLSRLLGPEILGVVVIAQAVRTGCDLLTDLGPEQNVVHSPHGEDERFLNTVWTLQVLRGLLVSLACLALSPVLAHFYRIDVGVLMVVSAAPLLNSFMSTSIFSAAKRMDVKARNMLELVAEVVGLAINLGLALSLRSVWAPILGIVLSIAARSALTYWLPHPRHRFLIDRAHAAQILGFSKWIMLSSVSFYAAIFADRLYLGRVVSLATLGVYGLARSVSELPATVAGRLAFQIVFPFVAQHGDAFGTATPARKELGRMRGLFLLLVLAGIATVMAWSDWAVRLVYGHRYIEAGWMVSLLLVGGWISVLCSLNEATVFGRGAPRNVGFANLLRFGTMAAVLPIGFHTAGLPGALLALPASELMRYFILLKAQRRLRTTFVAQDVAFSLTLLGVFGAWVLLRLAMGLGEPWQLMS